MNRRTRKALNLIAFTLLFLSLYLNFIYKDHNIAPIVSPAEAAVTGNATTTHAGYPLTYDNQSATQPGASPTEKKN